MNKEGQVERSYTMQVVMGMVDSLGYCLLAAPSDHSAASAFFKDLLKVRYGLEVTEEELMEIGKQTLRDEIKFNKGAEFSTIHGPDPEFYRNEALAPTGSVFDVDPEEVATIWERL